MPKAGDVPWLIEPLGTGHDRDAFSCGEPPLDEFLRRYARQNEERGASRTFVAVRNGANAVEGYFTLRSGEVAFAAIPDEDRRRLPRYPVPVVHLARLAVAQTAQGHGLGEQLLVHALTRAVRVSMEIGVYAVEVHAKHHRARSFYARYGFQSLVDDQLHMYQSIKAIEVALRKAGISSA